MKLLRRTWADIDLDLLSHNYNALRGALPQKTKFLGVVKADAYGHGAGPMAHALISMGAEYLAVATIEEAVQLRRDEIRTPVLIFGYTPATYAEMMVFMNITQEVHSLQYAKELDAQLKNTNYLLKVHLQLDTGMTRIGFRTDSELFAQEMEELNALRHIHVEGVFTHFSAADSLDADDVAFTRGQHTRFMQALDLLDSIGIRAELKHCCNSAATVLYPEYAMDMVRPGILVYGIHPSPATKGKIDVQPVLSLRSIISQIWDVKAGTPVSYGRTFIAPKDFRMAVVPAGYADGLSRGLSNRGSFLLHGKRVPVVGRICMDMCMVDISSVPDAKVGDVVTIIGADGGDFIHADEISSLTETISYETLCAISKRVPRIYLSGGKESQSLRYIV